MLRITAVDDDEYADLEEAEFARTFSFAHDEFDSFKDDDDRFKLVEIYVNGDTRLFVAVDALSIEVATNTWQPIDADFEIIWKPFNDEEIRFILTLRNLVTMPIPTRSFWMVQRRLRRIKIKTFFVRQIAQQQCESLLPKTIPDVVARVFRHMTND